MYARATDCITGRNMAGMLRRPVLDEETWVQVLLNLVESKAKADDTNEVANGYAIQHKPSLVILPKNTALEILQQLHQAEDTNKGSACRGVHVMLKSK